ncbi:T6SS immunity protein Tdi1 domain-containing protein [Pseudomonas sp. R76]|uniref:T6SS immunity protein Tdi1 domain-containing protein n=1 Tax=Pseudomonas sp. R76 TaxID=1573711 RepID=UPI00131FA424|nr:T6SS immunity protein Tdi1 domain-containing protein [Pseudomonas sp. R76]QHD07060.1 DUF1851 domain-containing protein [Pseudomonas sp. R76]
MYDIFRSCFLIDYRVNSENMPVFDAKGDYYGLVELISEFGGCSFENALYRVMKPSSINEWNKTIKYAFPDFYGRVQCFGFDWLGRIFALDSGRLEEGYSGVVMFEPGTGQVLEIPCNIVTFHNQELVEYSEEALAVSFRLQWLIRGAAPSYEECVGYKIPLFLGGRDVTNNLGILNLDVYWTLTAQLIRKARGLPPGTVLGKITSVDGTLPE